MGMIRIQMLGSFPGDSFEVCAEEGGHANAIQRAIRWLIDKQPDAIQQDHRLHEDGVRPPKRDFGRGGV